MTETKPKEINLLNKLFEKSSQSITSLNDLSEETKLLKIIKVM